MPFPPYQYHPQVPRQADKANNKKESANARSQITSTPAGNPVERQIEPREEGEDARDSAAIEYLSGINAGAAVANATFAGVLVLVTVGLLLVARTQNRFMMLTQRAHVVFSGFRITDFSECSDPIFWLSFTNSGHVPTTATLNIDIRLMTGGRGRERIAGPGGIVGLRERVITIPAGESEEIFQSWGQKYLPSDTIDTLQRGNAHLFVSSSIKYGDGFSKDEIVSHYCVQYVAWGKRD